MENMKRLLSIFLFFILGYSTQIAYAEPFKTKVLLHLNAHQVVEAIKHYQRYKSPNHHDSEVLQKLGEYLIEEGLKSKDGPTKTSALYAISLTNMQSLHSKVAPLIASKNPNLQLSSIHLLSRIGLDEIESVLRTAMTSPYLQVRFEALHALIQRKSRFALNYLDSTMNLLPEEFLVYFANLYADLATIDAKKSLKILLHHKRPEVRTACMMAIASHHFDEFTNDVANALNQVSPLEQEAACVALKMMGSKVSLSRLKELTTSPYSEVRVAALSTLLSLNEYSYYDALVQEAEKGSIFAITELTRDPKSVNVLKELIKSKDTLIKLNSAIGLLYLKDPSCVDSLMPWLIQPQKMQALIPFFSPSRGMSALKTTKIPPSYKPEQINQLKLITRSIRQKMLSLMVELNEDIFIKSVETIFSQRQNDLIPLAVELLDNTGTAKALELLSTHANKPGHPLLRGYCQLKLYQRHASKDYDALFIRTLKNRSSLPLFRFEDASSRLSDVPYTKSFFLNPEEETGLIIDSYLALANSHSHEGIDLLLEAIEKGPKSNHPVLGGLLLKALSL